MKKQKYIEKIANHKDFNSAFFSKENFEYLYFKQKNCYHFGIVSVPLINYYYIFRMIENISRRDILGTASYMPELTPFVGLICGLDIKQVNHENNHSKLIINKNIDKINNYVANMYRIYSIAKEKILINYIDSENLHKNEKKGKYSKEFLLSTETDFKYANAFKVLIRNSFDELFNDKNTPLGIPIDFYILFFCDLYIFLRHMKKTNCDNEKLKLLSKFILCVLPFIIGRYRFGEMGNKLKDLAFLYANTQKYIEVKKQIGPLKERAKWAVEVKDYIEQQLKKEGISAIVKTRNKSVFSSYVKSIVDGVEVNKLWDLAGVRVIIDNENVDHCLKTLEIVEKKWRKLPDKKGFKNYIAEPKDNGYQTIHMVIQNIKEQLIEVQIRTKLMHHKAEFGEASHSNYKLNKNTRKNIKKVEYSLSTTERGKKLIEEHLMKNDLFLNDFISYMKESLEHIPIEHYYSKINDGFYDMQALIEMVKFHIIDKGKNLIKKEANKVKLNYEDVVTFSEQLSDDKKCEKIYIGLAQGNIDIETIINENLIDKIEAQKTRIICKENENLRGNYKKSDNEKMTDEKVEKGKEILQEFLNNNNLSFEDFKKLIDPGLEKVPIEIYYLQIYKGVFDLELLRTKVKLLKKQKEEK